MFGLCAVCSKLTFPPFGKDNSDEQVDFDRTPKGSDVNSRELARNFERTCGNRNLNAIKKSFLALVYSSLCATLIYKLFLYVERDAAGR